MELRSCPFCGCSAVIKHLDVFGGKWFYVKCQWCYAEINNLVPSEKEAIEAWNKRADDGKENENWNLCCDLPHPDYPCGFLCYEDTAACKDYEEGKYEWHYDGSRFS